MTKKIPGSNPPPPVGNKPLPPPNPTEQYTGLLVEKQDGEVLQTFTGTKFRVESDIKECIYEDYEGEAMEGGLTVYIFPTSCMKEVVLEKKVSLI